MESIEHWERYGFLDMNFKLESSANFKFLGGIKFVNKLFIKLLNFIRISN